MHVQLAVLIGIVLSLVPASKPEPAVGPPLDEHGCPSHVQEWRHHLAKRADSQPDTRDHFTILADANIRAFVGARVGNPMVNDCQALVANRSYGPVVTVFANDSTPTGHLDKTKWYMVALIYNAGMKNNRGAEYLPLHIKAGYSCLYLPMAAETIKDAHIVHRGEGTCEAEIAAPTQPRLSARIRPKVEATDSIPRAARWEWDARHSVQYIGVTCGTNWCEIGQREFRPARDPDTTWVSSVDGLTVSAVHRVRAYFDEQELAVVAKPGSDSLKPSGVRAIFFSVPASDTIQDARGNYYLGTMMIIRGGSSVYETKLGLEPGSPTHIYFDNTPAVIGTDSSYHAYLKRGGVEKQKKWQRFPDPRRPGEANPINMTGMVRWRWLRTDETTWIRCLEGCCTTQ